MPSPAKLIIWFCRFQGTIILIAPTPVFPRVSKENPFGLEACSHQGGMYTVGETLCFKKGWTFMSTPGIYSPLVPLFLVYKPPAEQVRQDARPEGQGFNWLSQGRENFLRIQCAATGISGLVHAILRSGIFGQIFNRSLTL